jgi:ferritin-like protein
MISVAAAELTTFYYYTILRGNLIGIIEARCLNRKENPVRSRAFLHSPRCAWKGWAV